MPVSAEHAPTEVIVVTAKRTPISIGQLSANTTVITSEQIRQRQYQVLSEALQSVPGLHLAASGGLGAQTSVFIRGAESDHVLVLIDGVEVSDPTAATPFEFGQLSLNGVERIEVLRGNYSAQYGSEAIGGVINIVTRTAEQAVSELNVAKGSLDSDSIALNLASRYKAIDLAFSGSYFATDGESFTPTRLRHRAACTQQQEERDGYRNRNAKINAGLNLNPNTRLLMNAEYRHTDSEYDAGICENRYSEQSSYSKHTSVALTGDYLNSRWQPVWRLNYYRSQRNAYNQNSVNHFAGKRLQLSWHNLWHFNEQIQVSFGIETELEKATTTRTSADFQASARTNAVYAELRYNPWQTLYLNGGWRVDDADDFASERSYQLGAVWYAGAHARFHLNYATAFKAPSLSDRFRDFPAFGFSANPKLKPETSYGWEIGFEQNWNKGRFGLTYFHNEIRDLITTTDDFSTLTNKDKTRSEGLESFVEAQFNRNLSLRLDYTITRAKDEAQQHLLRRPLRNASLILSYSPLPYWSSSFILNYVGPQKDIDRVTVARIDKGGYTRADLKMRYSLNEKTHLVGSIDNVLDKSYQPINGFQAYGIVARLGLELSL